MSLPPKGGCPWGVPLFLPESKVVVDNAFAVKRRSVGPLIRFGINDEPVTHEHQPGAQGVLSRSRGGETAERSCAALRGGLLHPVDDDEGGPEAHVDNLRPAVSGIGPGGIGLFLLLRSLIQP